jgi:heme A synthase
VVAIAVITSSGWNESPEIVDGQGAPLLRPLAIAAPWLVLLQIVLGAAYHHRLTGVIPHMGGAMVASLTTLMAAMLVMQQYPRHRALRSAARWLMSIVLIQITLGVMAFSMQLLDVENWMALVIATASHAVVGSITLAASMVLAMQVQRNVRRALHYQSTSTADSVKVRHSMDY